MKKKSNFFFTSKGVLGRCKCASVKSMILALKLLIKLWIFKIFSIIWFYLLDHYLGFPKWYKTLFSVKNLGFYKSFKKENQLSSKMAKKISDGTGKNGLKKKIFLIFLSFIYIYSKEKVHLWTIFTGPP